MNTSDLGMKIQFGQNRAGLIKPEDDEIILVKYSR